YGLALPELPNRPAFAVVPLARQLDLEYAAQLSGAPLDLIQRLNAGFKRAITVPDGPQRLLLPIDHADRFASALRQLEGGREGMWAEHRVRPGDTLSHIAQAYGTTVAVLRNANALGSDLIRVGEVLLVPQDPAPTGVTLPAAGVALAAATGSSETWAEY